VGHDYEWPRARRLWRGRLDSLERGNPHGFGKVLGVRADH
jgi:hypothetical protein